MNAWRIVPELQKVKTEQKLPTEIRPENYRYKAESVLFHGNYEYFMEPNANKT